MVVLIVCSGTRVWKNVVRKGDIVVDATCGNGYDTLAMLRLIADDTRRGRVIAMDLQKDALQTTSSLLDHSLTAHEVLLFCSFISNFDYALRTAFRIADILTAFCSNS